MRVKFSNQHFFLCSVGVFLVYFYYIKIADSVFHVRFIEGKFRYERLLVEVRLWLGSFRLTYDLFL